MTKQAMKIQVLAAFGAADNADYFIRILAANGLAIVEDFRVPDDHGFVPMTTSEAEQALVDSARDKHVVLGPASIAKLVNHLNSRDIVLAKQVDP